MRVLSIAYPFAPVCGSTAGGAEHVLSMIDAGLASTGHDSIVIACEGSAVKGRLIDYEGAKTVDDGVMARVYCDVNAAIRRALFEHGPDVVHMHGVDFYRYLPPGEVPLLVTLHLPLHWYPGEAFKHAGPKTFYNCVSESQRRSSVSVGLDQEYLKVVGNGVPVEDLFIKVSRRGYALCLGRICPEKGFHMAIEASKLAGVPLVIAGSVFGYEAHERYFKEEIKPRLAPSIRHIGPVGLQRKRRLLTGARCVLVPSLAAETSSLVAMEALACGTPVVAFPNGALSEIVEDGRTGFLADGIESMARSIEVAHTIDPDLCRRTARERFSSAAMVEGYVSLYRELSA